MIVVESCIGQVILTFSQTSTHLWRIVYTIEIVGSLFWLTLTSCIWLFSKQVRSICLQPFNRSINWFGLLQKSSLHTYMHVVHNRQILMFFVKVVFEKHISQPVSCFFFFCFFFHKLNQEFIYICYPFYLW